MIFIADLSTLASSGEAEEEEGSDVGDDSPLESEVVAVPVVGNKVAAGVGLAAADVSEATGSTAYFDTIIIGSSLTSLILTSCSPGAVRPVTASSVNCRILFSFST